MTVPPEPYPGTIPNSCSYLQSIKLLLPVYLKGTPQHKPSQILQFSGMTPQNLLLEIRQLTSLLGHDTLAVEYPPQGGLLDIDPVLNFAPSKDASISMEENQCYFTNASPYGVHFIELQFYILYCLYCI